MKAHCLLGSQLSLMKTSSTVPNRANSDLSWLSVISLGKEPTKIFLPAMAAGL